MRFLMMFVLALAFTGCTKTQTCDLGKTATSLVAAQISTSLECKNLDAVKADIEKKLVDLKICEAKPEATAQTMAAKSAIGDVICKPVIDGLTAGLIGQIPKAWECSGGSVTEDLKLKLLEACNKAL